MSLDAHTAARTMAAVALLGLCAAPAATARPKADRLGRCLSALKQQDHGPKRACFGASGAGVARADFNSDGAADVAVGVPDEDLELITGTIPDAGAVHVLYGPVTGAGPARVRVITQAGDAGRPEAGDRFGASLAAAGFNGDELTDLAVGVPGEGVSSISDAGAVAAYYATTAANGIDPAAEQLWTQDSEGGSVEVRDAAEAGDQWGFSLTWGQFDGKNGADLAVGVPGESIGTAPGAGAVGVLYSFDSGFVGLSPVGNQLWSQQSSAVADVAEAGDRFGATLTSANFGRSPEDDLVVGVPLEDLSAPDAGALQVVYGTPDALGNEGALFLHQDSTGVAEAGETGDRFASALAPGDFTGDGVADLAVGTPREDVLDPASGRVEADAGAVQVLPGSQALGIHTSGDQVLSQESGSIADEAEAGDQFGFALAANELTGGGPADLAVGAPLEDMTAKDAGLVHVLPGTAGEGLSTAGLALRQSSSGDAEAPSDRFGAALAAWRIDSDQHPDLAVGAPGESSGDPAAGEAGKLHLLLGAAAFSSGAVIAQGPLAGGLSEAGDRFGSVIY